MPTATNTVSYTVIAREQPVLPPARHQPRHRRAGRDRVAGEPQPDAQIDQPSADHVARFNAINARNYSDLWFYSNPVFVKVAAQ
jgi:hypothetical protein